MDVADAIAALPIKNYAAVNSAMTDTPVRGAPAAYDPTALVRTSSVTAVPPLSFSAVSADPAIATVSVNGSDLSVHPVAVGSTSITVTATDLDAQNVNSMFLLSVNDSYSTWAARQPFPSPADAEASADPDKDGRINLAEFALASPALAATASDPVAGLDQGKTTLTFNLRRYMDRTTVVTLQTADNLTGPWTDRWKSTDGLEHPWIASQTVSPEFLTLTARDPEPLPAGPATRRFLRLKIAQ